MIYLKSFQHTWGSSSIIKTIYTTYSKIQNIWYKWTFLVWHTWFLTTHSILAFSLWQDWQSIVYLSASHPQLGGVPIWINFCFWATHPGVDPEFVLGEGAALMNDITDRWCKQMLQNSSYIRTSQAILGGCVPGGGALGYFLGGYVPPGTSNWHPILKKMP